MHISCNLDSIRMYVCKIHTMIINRNLTMITSWSKVVNLNCVATGVAKGRHWGLLSWVHPGSNAYLLQQYALVWKMYRCCGLPWHNGPEPKCTYTNFSCTTTMTAQISLWMFFLFSCLRLMELSLTEHSCLRVMKN